MFHGNRQATGFNLGLPNHQSKLSLFEVWDNIAEQEVEELEGIFRHVFRHDPQANRLNRQRAYKPLKRVCLVSDTA